MWYVDRWEFGVHLSETLYSQYVSKSCGAWLRQFAFTKTKSCRIWSRRHFFNDLFQRSKGLYTLPFRKFKKVVRNCVKRKSMRTFLLDVFILKRCVYIVCMFRCSVDCFFTNNFLKMVVLVHAGRHGSTNVYMHTFVRECIVKNYFSVHVASFWNSSLKWDLEFGEDLCNPESVCPGFGSVSSTRK